MTTRSCYQIPTLVIDMLISDATVSVDMVSGLYEQGVQVVWFSKLMDAELQKVSIWRIE